MSGEAHLRRRIALEGPLTLADFMADALGHPQHGYYMTRDPFGRGGDFTTAPEISQMFGELIGLWCAETWLGMGAPKRVHLVELGPGRGTLMADLLRAGRRAAGFDDASQVHLVETSPVLRGVQAKTLGDRPVWHADISKLPDDAPILVVANEFFDALPIRQLQRTEAGWRERIVGMAAGDGGALSIGLASGPCPAEALIDPGTRQSAKPGKIVEIAPLAWRIAGDLGARLKAQGGAALVVDYGYAGPATGDTLQAVQAHKPCDVLHAPGEVDLTAHVDFTALARAASEAGARAAPLAEQGAFLSALGIGYRADALSRAAPDKARAIIGARDRLIGPDGMGTLFKVLGLAGPGTPPLPGLEA